MSKYVILGSNGIVGRSLLSELPKFGHEVLGLNRNNLNIHSQIEISELVKNKSETIFVNCIAYMPADKCETDAENSSKININFVNTLAKEIEKTKSNSLVHFSSDFIFDGNSVEPYTESSEPRPLNVYGRQKVQTEFMIQEILVNRGKIIRFASLVAKTQERKTFLEKVIDRAKETKSARVVDDLRISTTTIDLLTSTVAGLHNIEKPIIHAVHQEETSWFKIAQLAFEVLGIDVLMEAIPHTAFNTPAPRPIYSVMKPSPEVVDIDNRNWHDAISDFCIRYFR